MFTTLATSSQPTGFGLPTSGTTRVSVRVRSAAWTVPAALSGATGTTHVPCVGQDLTVIGGFTAADGTVRKNAYPGTSVWSPPVE